MLHTCYWQYLFIKTEFQLFNVLGYDSNTINKPYIRKFVSVDWNNTVTPIKLMEQISECHYSLCAALQQLMLHFEFPSEHQCIPYVLLVSHVNLELPLTLHCQKLFHSQKMQDCIDQSFSIWNPQIIWDPWSYSVGVHEVSGSEQILLDTSESLGKRVNFILFIRWR